MLICFSVARVPYFYLHLFISASMNADNGAHDYGWDSLSVQTGHLLFNCDMFFNIFI